MNIVRVTNLPESWTIQLDNGDTYTLNREEVINMDGQKYADLMDFFATISLKIQTSEKELVANGFKKING